jgi:hypothetical protein
MSFVGEIPKVLTRTSTPPKVRVVAATAAPQPLSLVTSNAKVAVRVAEFGRDFLTPLPVFISDHDFSAARMK